VPPFPYFLFEGGINQKYHESKVFLNKLQFVTSSCWIASDASELVGQVSAIALITNIIKAAIDTYLAG